MRFINPGLWPVLAALLLAAAGPARAEKPPLPDKKEAAREDVAEAADEIFDEDEAEFTDEDSKRAAWERRKGRKKGPRPPLKPKTVRKMRAAWRRMDKRERVRFLRAHPKLRRAARAWDEAGDEERRAFVETLSKWKRATPEERRAYIEGLRKRKGGKGWKGKDGRKGGKRARRLDPETVERMRDAWAGMSQKEKEEFLAVHPGVRRAALRWRRADPEEREAFAAMLYKWSSASPEDRRGLLESLREKRGGKRRRKK